MDGMYGQSARMASRSLAANEIADARSFGIQ
jgi:hypothetical protein